jgi:amphiphysin
MSWKGFKRAVTRLPQQVLQKAGYADETYDEEYEALAAEFKDLEHSSKVLAEETKLYLTAVRNLLSAQKNLATGLQQLFNPPGGSPDGAPQSEYEQASSEYVNTTNQWIETMSPYMDRTIQNVVLDASTALQLVIKQVRGTLEKRGRKLIDYDRTRNALRKIKDKNESTASEANKLAKAQAEFDEAKNEYETLNDRIKVEIPIFIKLRIDFMDPVMEALISFQVYLFEQGFNALNGLSQYIDYRPAIIETYMKKRTPALDILKELTLVPSKKIDPEAVIEESAEKDEKGDNPPNYNDSDTKLPSPMNPTPSNSAPPVAQERNSSVFAISVYPFQSDTPGDLPFEKDEKIQIIQKTENQEDWWMGRIGDKEGYFPANYVKLL